MSNLRLAAEISIQFKGQIEEEKIWIFLTKKKGYMFTDKENKWVVFFAGGVLLLESKVML